MLFVFLANPHELIEQDRVLLFRLKLVSVVFTDLSLQEVAHLRQFRLTLRLQALDEVGHLLVLVLSHAQLLSQVVPSLLGSLLLLAKVVELDEQVLKAGLGIVVLQLQIRDALVC